MQRFGHFPGYSVQEALDSPRYYERFLATDEMERDQWVIIRSLARDLCHTAELRLFYQDACRRYAHVRMDGIVPIKEIGESQTHGIFTVFYLNFSYLTFGEIAALAHSRKILVDAPFFTSILLDAVRTLKDAHAQELEHYTLLPSDIHISMDGDVYVVGYSDAAMRRRFHFETELDEKYSAPEWRRHETLSVESDVYAVGALLYQALTGEFQPDEWEPRWMGMMDILNRAHIPGESLQTALNFFEHTLAERVQQRYSSYEQLEQALTQLLAEFGSYVPRELRVDALKYQFDEFPPRREYVSGENSGVVRSDIINLITGEMPCLTATLQKRGSDGTMTPVSTVIRRNSAEIPSSVSAAVQSVALGDTLTASPEGIETKILHRSSGSFRTVSPNLRSSISVSPLQILARSRYQVLDLLGTGGTGTVYKVLDTTLTEVLALKVLKPELVSDSAWLQRFKRELKIARDLEHEYILPAYHLEQMEGLYFFTMRYIQGRNLSEILKTDPNSLSLTLMMRILCAIGEALVAAHDLGIIHRDIKPANIMVEDDSHHPYLMDFGIASAPDNNSLTMAGQGIGTPSYMAPEQSRGDVISVHADIFSFGVVCYECFTHRLPYNGSTPIAIYNAQQSGQFEPICDINPRIPQPLACLIESCLSPIVGNRPGSMRILVDAFNQAIAYAR